MMNMGIHGSQFLEVIINPLKLLYGLMYVVYEVINHYPVEANCNCCIFGRIPLLCG